MQLLNELLGVLRNPRKLETGGGGSLNLQGTQKLGLVESHRDIVIGLFSMMI